MNIHHSHVVRRFASALVALALVLCAGTVPAMAAAEGKVNINTADEATLQFLPRVGPAVSKRIVEYREENGKFAEATDLMQVRGIGEKTFQLLEPYVSTTGESTLKEKVRTSRSDASSEETDGGGAEGGSDR